MKLLLALLGVTMPAIVAYPDEVVLSWQLPTTYVDGSPIPLEAYRAANVYCGPRSGTYDELTTWEGPATMARVEIEQAPKFCAVTLLIAQPADVIGDPERIDESAYSNEVRLAQALANAPIIVRATYPDSPRMCTTTCVLDPPRVGVGSR